MYIFFLLSITEAELISWADRVIRYQYNMAVLSIIVIIALAGLIASATVAFYFYIIRHRLKTEINKFEQKIIARDKEDFEKLVQKIDVKVDEIKNDIETKTDRSILKLTAEKARLFALICYRDKNWEDAAIWWAEAVEDYNKVGQDDILKTSVEALDVSLGNCKALTKRNKKLVKRCLPYIPLMLVKLKEEIEKKLTCLPVEDVEQKKAKEGS